MCVSPFTPLWTGAVSSGSRDATTVRSGTSDSCEVDNRTVRRRASVLCTRPARAVHAAPRHIDACSTHPAAPGWRGQAPGAGARNAARRPPFGPARWVSPRGGWSRQRYFVDRGLRGSRPQRSERRRQSGKGLDGSAAHLRDVNVKRRRDEDDLVAGVDEALLGGWRRASLGVRDAQ